MSADDRDRNHDRNRSSDLDRATTPERDSDGATATLPDPWTGRVIREDRPIRAGGHGQTEPESTDHPRATLTEGDVYHMRLAYTAGRDPEKPHAPRVSYAEIADAFGVSDATAFNAITGETYADVGGPLWESRDFASRGGYGTHYRRDGDGSDADRDGADGGG